MISLSLNALLVLLWNVNRRNQIKLSFSPSINLQPAGLNWAYLHYTYVIGKGIDTYVLKWNGKKLNISVKPGRLIC